MSKARNLAGFISDATVEAAEIADNAITNAKVAVNAIASENLIALNVTHDKLHTDMDLSTKTITLAADAISGNNVHSGTISDFASTGIDDNATSTVVTVASTGKVGVGATVPGNHLTVYAASATTLQLANATTTAGAGDGLLISQIGDNAVISNAEVGYLKLKTNGNDRLTITSAGNVGIGTVSPSQKLHVVGKIHVTDDIQLNQTNSRLDYDGGSSSGALRFWSTSGNAEKMRISSAGNVGIGTTTPATKLHVSGGSDNIRLDNTGSGNYGLEILRNGTKSASFAWGEGNANLEIKNYRNDSQADGPYANIDFFTGGTNATSPNFNPDLRMRIQQTGDVGIGTSNPFSKLHINSNGAPATSGNMTTGLTVSNSLTGSAINIGTYDAGGYSYIQSAYVNNAGVARDLGFRIGDTEMLRLNSSSLSLYKKNYGTSSSVVHSGHLTRFRWATQANDTWRTICSLNDFHGRIFVSASDASSGDRAEWSVRTTSPAYGVSSFTQIYYHNGGWNTGSFDLRYTNISGTYYLQGKASSYYSTSNNFQFDIEFNKSQ